MIEKMTVTELASQIKTKDLSPAEVVDHFLWRIQSYNPGINAFVTMNENIKQEAKKAEEAVTSNQKLGPLHGVPIAIKDLTPTKGLRTTYGSPAFENHIPDRDAIIVKRLKEAGALIMGKTNTPDFGHKGTTDNLLFGPTKNPWDLDKTAGGSSGGSAAAVSANLIPFAEGSDGGGSIRIPASFCGVYGFKPTYGRIPNDNNLSNAFGSSNPFVNHGPITKSVADAALFLEVVQGPTSTDPYSLPVTGDKFTENLDDSIKGMKIAYTPDFGMHEVMPEVSSVVGQSLNKWRSLGCEVEEVTPDFDMNLHEFLGFFKNMWYAAAAAGSGPLLEQHPEWVSPSYKTMIEKGFKLSAAEYKQLDAKRTKVWSTMQELFENYDLVLSPTLAVTAFDYQLLGPEAINGEPIEADSDWMMTHVYNMTGLPAASIPAGLSPDGLPVGIQIAGNRFNDALVLRASRAYEKISS